MPDSTVVPDPVTAPASVVSSIESDITHLTVVFQDMSFPDMLDFLAEKFLLSDREISALIGSVTENLPFWRSGAIPEARRYTTLRSLCVLSEVVAQSYPDVASWFASYPVSHEPFTRANIFTVKGASPLLDDLLGRFSSSQNLIDTVFVGWAELPETDKQEHRDLYALSFTEFLPR